MTDLLIGLMNAPRRVQRLTALAMLGLGFFFAIWLVMLAIFHLREQANEIDERRFELGRLNALLERKPADVGAVSAGLPPPTDLYLDGETMPVTKARLQQRINELSAQTGAVVASINNVPDATPDAVPLIGVVADIQGSLKAIHDMIRQIETSTPPLVIRKALFRMTTPVQEGQLRAPLQLAVTMEIYGSADPALIAPAKATQPR
ncbi:hypothetical protein CO659_16580 [Rhizobium sp. S9]|uniref:type II secretion system protein GspM n=1 Tax=unclassified Rhizobium TaxID=2613769 RepID=UPI000A20FE88|nr:MULTISPECIES: type II secretion system protein GspM [unclassified Rhizobium]ARO26437.1 type II secretion system protein M [Rhizobium sp. TAL182]PDS96533.1 hypothetical protein CO659_16580 [Rhizobium sp. S9]